MGFLSRPGGEDLKRRVIGRNAVSYALYETRMWREGVMNPKGHGWLDLVHQLGEAQFLEVAGSFDGHSAGR